MLRCLSLFLIAVGLVLASDAPPKEVDMQWGVKIPLRDGVHLNATVYRPHEQKEALPVIFTLTPVADGCFTLDCSLRVDGPGASRWADLLAGVASAASPSIFRR